jgi:hypothetical protein
MPARSRNVRGIPSTDTGALRRAARRTGIVRWLLVATACGLLLAALVSARSLDTERGELLPGGTSGVVVLDVSLSITDREFRNVRTVLERLVRSDGAAGLVVFSDIAYELLPPRTPLRELRPLVRFFVPTGGHLPPNPWADMFQAGTRISAALELAESMLRRDGVTNGSILLVSDLSTAPSDLSDLGKQLDHLSRSPIAVRVVPLAPSSDGVLLVERTLGPDAFTGPLSPTSDEEARLDAPSRGDSPTALLVLGTLVFLALAAHERFAGRLALPAPSRWRKA